MAYGARNRYGSIARRRRPLERATAPLRARGRAGASTVWVAIASHLSELLAVDVEQRVGRLRRLPQRGARVLAAEHGVLHGDVQGHDAHVGRARDGGREA